MAVDGSDEVNLTNDPTFDALAAWSADGTRLAFVSDRSGNREIYTIVAMLTCTRWPPTGPMSAT
jgi:Tol biopolymer transport system component